MTAFPNQSYNMLGSVLFSVGAVLPFGWSGTNIPDGNEREDRRSEAEQAKENNDDRDESLTEDIYQSIGPIEIDHVIIGAGYAACINIATLGKGQATQPNGFPKIIMIGKNEPWSQFERRHMGQSPTNLSPDAFSVLPLHLFPKDTEPQKPTDPQDYNNFPHCFLNSKYFASAIAHTRDSFTTPALQGVVTKVEIENDGFITITVESDPFDQQSQGAVIKTKNLDITSGMGPPRKLPDDKFDDEIRDDLRSSDKHLYGGEALKEETDIPEPNSKVLIYGGAATSAWVYERFYKSMYIHGGDNESWIPPDIYWVAPYRGEDEEGMSDEEKKRFAFIATEVGLRNKLTLKDSEDRRYVAGIENVTFDESDDGNSITVKFDKELDEEHGAEVEFDMIVESIGRDASRIGGAIHFLRDFQIPEGDFETIPENSNHGDRPLGIRYKSGGTDLSIRIFGAAAVVVSSSILVNDRVPFKSAHGTTSDGKIHFPRLASLINAPSDVVFDETFGSKMDEFLKTLPEEASIPPGITVAGITISRANDADYGVSTERQLNINTASKEELSTRPDRFDENNSPLFSDDEAEKIVECRSIVDAGIPSFPGEPSVEDWYSGFRGIDDIENDKCDLPDGIFDRVKLQIRV